MALFQFFCSISLKYEFKAIAAQRKFGKFHSLTSSDEVTHTFTYYSLAQNTSDKCNFTEFYAAYRNAVRSHLVMCEDATHKPMSFKATHVTQPCISVNSLTKERPLFHTIQYSYNYSPFLQP
jgi:hypothetical protein